MPPTTTALDHAVRRPVCVASSLVSSPSSKGAGALARRRLLTTAVGDDGEDGVISVVALTVVLKKRSTCQHCQSEPVHPKQGPTAQLILPPRPGRGQKARHDGVDEAAVRGRGCGMRASTELRLTVQKPE